jgi:hypothetical protein
MHNQLNVPSCGINLNEFENIFNQSLESCISFKLYDVLKGKKIIFSVDERSLVPINGWGSSRYDSYCTKITTLNPIRERTIIAAIDSSDIQIAETEEGALYAIKSGIALAIDGQALMHFKIGPVLFYFSDETIRHSELDHRIVKLVLFDSEYAKRLMRVRVERAIQMELSRHFTKSIILIDGPLKSSLFDKRSHSIKKIAENCSLYKNSLIGISKSTKLKVLERISVPLTKVTRPAYIDVDLIIKGLTHNTIGSNLLIKFGNNNSPVLRADLITADGNKDKALGKLLGNDSVSCGYPETLQLAHHISTFTNTDISCLRGHILSNYDVIELASEDVRRRLLGSILV